MNTSEIRCFIKGHDLLSTIVKGVYSSDTLPSKIDSYPSAYVCNTDTSHLPGEHWVVFWMDSPQKAEFFDSLGKPPEYYDERFKTFLMLNSENTVYSNKPLQKKSAETCGYHVLLFLLLKSRKYSLSYIVQYISRQDNPDLFVYRLVSDYTDCL